MQVKIPQKPIKLKYKKEINYSNIRKDYEIELYRFFIPANKNDWVEFADSTEQTLFVLYN